MNTLPELFETSAQSSNNSNKLTIRGKILLGITGGIAVGLTIISAPFLTPALRRFCLPYVPATRRQIENIVEALDGRHRDSLVVDLGSGDGRIVFELARRNFHVHGVELNPWLVLYSKIQTLRYGLNDRVRFYRTDLWKFSLNNYDNIVIFGVEQMMADLEMKFDRECRNDCNIIACRFPLPNKIPKKTIGCGIDTVWIYQQ